KASVLCFAPRSSRASRASRCFFFSSRRRHTRSKRDWSSDVCSSDLNNVPIQQQQVSPSTPMVNEPIYLTTDKSRVYYQTCIAKVNNQVIRVLYDGASGHSYATSNLVNKL